MFGLWAGPEVNSWLRNDRLKPVFWWGVNSELLVPKAATWWFGDRLIQIGQVSSNRNSGCCAQKRCWLVLQKNFSCFLIIFLLKDNCFTEFCCFLSNLNMNHPSDQIRSVAQSCLTLCNPMNRSMPGLPVHHQLTEFTQTHIHRVNDAIQPSHPLSSPSPPAPSPSQHQSLFQWVNSSQEVAKVLKFQL